MKCWNILMASKGVIAVYIDEVLTPHFQYLMDWYNREYGTKLTLANNHPKTTEGWGTDKIEEAIKRVQRFFDTDEFKESKPFEEAIASVKQLSRSYEMVIITSRDTIIEHLTRGWLDRHFPELFKEAHFTAMFSLEGKNRSKAEVAKNLGVRYLIDDSLEHIEAASEAGINGLLFGDYPWNQTDKLPNGVVRVKNWKEVLEYFDGRG
jgi:uncharacterized HAD superfamily protein